MQLAREAARGLSLLVADGDDNEAFDALFMTPVAFAERFDLYVRSVLVWRCKISPLTRSDSSGLLTECHVCNYDCHSEATCGNV